MADTLPEESETAESEVEKTETDSLNGEKASLSSAEVAAARRGSRDLQVSTLVHLLGLPTAKDLQVLESKIDSLGSRMTVLGAKLDKLSGNSEIQHIGGVLDRIDFQIADLRTIIKKVLPQALVSEFEREMSEESTGKQEAATPSPAASARSEGGTGDA